jgi:hypothetical protein
VFNGKIHGQYDLVTRLKLTAARRMAILISGTRAFGLTAIGLQFLLKAKRVAQPIQNHGQTFPRTRFQHAKLECRGH